MNNDSGILKMENTPEIETDRLILRAFKEEDAGDLFLLLKDEEVNTFLPWFPVKTFEQAQTYFRENYLDYYRESSAYRYAVCLKSDNRPIGYVIAGNNDSRDFGYGLRKEFWHRGITTEACMAVVQQLRKAGYPYITATHDVKNPRSGEIMKNIGMKYGYSYVELWQPKNILVTFRMYQLNFDDANRKMFTGYWDKYPEHFIEENI